MTLELAGHFLNLAINLVGFVGAIFLLRYLADSRWVIGLVGVNVVVLARRAFEIGVGLGVLEPWPVVNGFGVPFVHGTLLAIGTIGSLNALRRGRGELFRIRPKFDRRYRELCVAAAAVDRLAIASEDPGRAG